MPFAEQLIRHDFWPRATLNAEVVAFRWLALLKGKVHGSFEFGKASSRRFKAELAVFRLREVR